MKRAAIPIKTRLKLEARAEYRCEYCLLPKSELVMGLQVDHIVSLKHGGSNYTKNLCMACVSCNLNEGSDIATIFPPSNTLYRFYNPRKDSWAEHFSFDNGEISPLSKIGEATIKILQLNIPDRVLRRKILADCGVCRTF